MGGKTKGPLLRIIFFNVNVSPKYNYLQIQVSTSQTRDMCWKLYEDMAHFQGTVCHIRYPKY